MTTAARIKSICLRSPEVLALLKDGRATVDRDMRPQPAFGVFQCDPPDDDVWMTHGPLWREQTATDGQEEIHCPFGRVGERKQVFETWAPSFEAPKIRIAYKADGLCVGVAGDGDGGWMQVKHGWLFPDVTDKGPSLGRSLYQSWRSPTQMPRIASRLTPETLAVSVARDERGVWLWRAELGRTEG